VDGRQGDRTFGPRGPALVLLDEIEDLQALAVRTRVNGETVQDGTTASMIFPVAETIAVLSRVPGQRPNPEDSLDRLIGLLLDPVERQLRRRVASQRAV
jgi:hypothetical protein